MAELLLSEERGVKTFLVENTEWGPNVIRKVLDRPYPSERDLREFHKEYKLLTKLSINGLRKPLGSKHENGKPTTYFNYFDGITLKKMIENGLSDLNFLLDTALFLSDTLSQLHNKKILHRNVSAKNVLFNSKSKEYCLIDFASATTIKQKKHLHGGAEMIAGDLEYIAPEQTGRINRQVDHRTDLYATGVVMYEMATGILPFPQNNALETIYGHIAVIPLAPSQVNSSIPEPLSKIIMKLLEKDAEARYQSAIGLRKDLEHVLGLIKSNQSVDFEIGSYDKSITLSISQKLYGRDQEIQSLSQHFQKIANGSTGFQLVYGHSGSGKSSLVHEAYKALAKRKGYFLNGKFDQLQRNIPYYAIRQAINEYLNYLNTEEAAFKEKVKNRILKALENKGALLTEIIPELENLIGVQPQMAAADGVAGQNQFNYIFNEFLKVIAIKEQPIILFIDDLQWADLASIHLISNIIRNKQLKYFLLIGSFRENEVTDIHPVSQLIKECEKENVKIEHIRVGDLSTPDIVNLLKDSLHLPETAVKSLANRLYHQTEGNAFYTTQILQNLYDQGYLYFDDPQQRWLWDDSVISQMEMPENIVDLMSLRVKRLEPSTLDLLKKGSCFGNSFSSLELSMLLEMPLKAIDQHLVNAQEEGFVIEDEDIYRFLHDRIQQAVYSLIPDSEKTKLHYEIGTHLLEKYKENDEKIFEIVDQLNFGINLVKNAELRLEFAELNLRAGQSAISSTAYDAGLEYLSTGLEFIKRDWNNYYTLLRDLHTLAAEAAYLLGEYNKAEFHIQEVIIHATDILDKIPAYKLEIEALKSQNKLEEAVKKGLKVLALIDVKLSYNASTAEVFAHLANTRIKMLGKRPEDLLDLKRMNDPYQLAVMQILVSLGPAIYWASPNLTPITIFKMLLTSVKFGNTDESTFAYSTYGLLLCGVTGEIKLGQRFGKLALDLSEKVNAINKVKGIFNVYCFVHHWSHSLRESFQPFKEAHLLGMSSGDLEFSALSGYLLCGHSFYAGVHLPDLNNDFKVYSEEINRIKQYTPLNYNLMHWQFALNMMQETSNPLDFAGPAYDEQVMVHKHEEANDKTALFKYHLLKMMMAFYFGNISKAEEYGKIGKKYLDAVTGMYVTVAFEFYYALVLASSKSSSELTTKLSIRAAIWKFKKWAAHNPINNQHKYELLKAEYFRITVKSDAARKFYNQSIASAKLNNSPHEAALAYELAGKYYFGNNEEDVADFYFKNASKYYDKWGATIKSRDIKFRYKLDDKNSVIDQTKGPKTTGNVLEKLDIFTITEAAETISDEIHFDQLKGTLLRILAKNAGAEKALLFLLNDNKAVLENSWPDDHENTIKYPDSIIDQVMNTGERMVSDKAMSDELFNKDNYITNHEVRSALCLPLFHQNDLIAIVYLENNVVFGAFSTSRLEFLKILSGQIAIALKNASLYQNLTEAYEEQVQLKNAYSKFVPIDFLQFLGKESILDISLGDQIQETVTVMFIDIMDYTSLSEKMSPKENFDFINATLSRLGPALRKYGGVISQFMGDGAMAIFKDAPDNALLAGIEMQRTLSAYNIERVSKNRRPIGLGVGIHTGKVMLGIIGEEMRMDQNVISDAVNIASRVQDLTRTYKTNIMLTGTSVHLLENKSEFGIRNLGRTSIKGRKEPIEIFECFDGMDEKTAEAKSQTAELFHQAIAAYYSDDFTSAQAEFEEVLSQHPEDRAAELYLQWSKEGLSEIELENRKIKN